MNGQIRDIENYYLPRIHSHNEDHLKLGWESKDAQFKRFSVLLPLLHDNIRLLDAGCGLGNLIDFIESSGIHVKYTGIDILDSFINEARSKRPDTDFHHADIFSVKHFADAEFDLVYSSGIFNIDSGVNEKVLIDALIEFDRLSSKYIVFNLLHVRSQDKENGYYYFDPAKVHDIVHSVLPGCIRIQIDDSYLKNDFSVIIYK